MDAVSLTRMDIDELSAHFAEVSRRVPLSPIRDDRDYDAAVRAMNALIDAGASSENHPLAALLDILGERIGDHDEARHRLPEAPPAEVLRFLMEQHDLKQGDLPEIGSQGVVSEILNGKRALNTGQIARLSERFGISPASFFERAHS